VVIYDVFLSIVEQKYGMDRKTVQTIQSIGNNGEKEEEEEEHMI